MMSGMIDSEANFQYRSSCSTGLDNRRSLGLSAAWPGSRSNNASDFEIDRLFSTQAAVTARISSTTSG